MDHVIMNRFLTELNRSTYPHLIQIHKLLGNILHPKKSLKKFRVEELLYKIDEEYASALQHKFERETEKKSQTSNGIGRYYEGQYTNYLIAFLFDITIDNDEIVFIYEIYKAFTSPEDIDMDERIELYNNIIINYIQLKKSQNDTYWRDKTTQHYLINVPTSLGDDGFVNIDREEIEAGGGMSDKKKYLKYKQKYLQLKNKLTNYKQID